MKSLTKVAIVIGACAALTVSCKKESVNPVNGTNAEINTQEIVGTEKVILTQPQVGPNLYAVDQKYTSMQIHLPTFEFSVDYYRYSPVYAQEKYKGVAAFGNLTATLYDTDKFSNPEDRIFLTTGQWGYVKYNGSPIEIEEIELLDGNMNNMYATKGSQLFRLTYNAGTPSTSPAFNATLIYTIPVTKGKFVVSTICPDATLANAFRVYYFLSPNLIPVGGANFGNFSYVTISNATGSPIIGLSTPTTNPVITSLSIILPIINSFRSTLDNSMYVTVNGAIRRVSNATGGMTNTTSSLIPTVISGVTYPKVDCAFGTY